MTATLTAGGTYYGPQQGDVVLAVTSGRWTQINTYAGNDAICVSGDAIVGTVYAGEGDDYVDTSALRSAPRPTGLTNDSVQRDVVVYLQGGNNTFTGGPALEYVIALQGHDVIQTSSGNDLVSDTGDSVIDSADGDDVVYVEGVAQVRLGAGNDVLGPSRATELHADGGDGVDTLGLSAPDQDTNVRINLPRGTYTSSESLIQVAADFENVGTRSFNTVRVTGTNDANQISIEGCRAVVHADGGSDDVTLSLDTCKTKTERSKSTFKAFSYDVSSGRGADQVRVLRYGRARLAGGPGTDDLRGGKSGDALSGGGGSDRLLGGPGFDVATGGGGDDMCRTERRNEC